MARGRAGGGVDDLVPIVLIAGAAYVLYFAISNTSSGKLCGSMNPIDIEARRTEKASFAAVYIKTYSKAPASLKSAAALAQSIKTGYPSAINNLVKLGMCGYIRAPLSSNPPAFWKAMGSLILTFNAHNLSTTTQLRPSALSAMQNMAISGNSGIIQSSYTQKTQQIHSYATGRSEEVEETGTTPEGFRFAEAVINVFDQTYKLKPEEQGNEEDYDVANTDNAVTVKS